MQILLAIMLLWILLQIIISATMLHHHDWQLVPQLSVPDSAVSNSSSSMDTLARSKSETSLLSASPGTNSRSRQPQEPENHLQHHGHEGAEQQQRERQRHTTPVQTQESVVIVVV